MPYENGPWKGQIDTGKKAFCACGESENKPYCDGSHARKETGKEPTVCEIAEVRRYAICQCGNTKNAPYCDGSHNRIS